MKLLLVNPRPRDPFTVRQPALGLCYLSSYLKSKGMPDVAGVDLNVDPDSVLEREIAKADVVGVYCSTKGLRPALAVADAARKAGRVVILGGPHPSVAPEETLAHRSVDYVVISEGEETLHALLQALEGGGDLSRIGGLGYKRGGGIVVKPRAGYIRDLDTLPFPDRGLFGFTASDPVAVCATRGCPYKCANCQPALSMQTCAFRRRSVENVMAELHAVGPGRHVHFVDNDLTLSRKWLLDLCDRIVSEGLGMTWDCQGRVNTLTPELMRAMKRAGCVAVGLGIESGSQALLDGFLRKQIDLAQAATVVRQSVEAGLGLHAWFMIGIPGETKGDIEKTISFATSHEFASVGFSIGTPWPGTLFQKLCDERGWFLTRDWEDFNEKRHSNLRTDEWDPEDIQRYREQIVRNFTSKAWVVRDGDFMFHNPYWRRSAVARAVKMPLVRMFNFATARGWLS